MSRTQKDLIFLYLLALVVNGLIAALIDDPGYVDAAYYYNGGVRIASGQPLSDPYIWNYLNAPDSLPTPAFTYWQPLPAFMAAAGIALFRGMDPFGAAQLVFVAAGSLIPLMAYAIAADLADRRQALLAGLLAVFSGFYVIRWAVPETFTPFALFGGGALALTAAARKKGRWWYWALAGVCSGLAYLTRSDGLLLLAVIFGASLLPSRELTHAWKARLNHAAVLLVAFICMTIPWFLRNAVVTGNPLPSGGFQTLWLTDYNEMFSYPADLSLRHYLDAGWQAIVKMKWQAFTANLLTFVAVHNLVFLTPLTVVGWWRFRRSEWAVLPMVYGVLLFLAMTFAFTLPGQRGGWLHSSAALFPFVTAFAALGLSALLEWAAQRFERWHYDRAWTGFGIITVAFAVVISAWLVMDRVVGLADLQVVAYNQQTAVYDQIEQSLVGQGTDVDTLVISNSPPGFYTRTGYGGIPLVNGDEQALLAAADAYGAEYLVIDHNVPAGLKSTYQSGPESPRLQLIGAYENPWPRTLLYRILPESSPSN
nr:glycosyltransferase family 39 protein [Anaerolineae bacterium]